MPRSAMGETTDAQRQVLAAIGAADMFRTTYCQLHRLFRCRCALPIDLAA